MNYKQLTEVERYQIESYLKAGYSQKQIAEELGKSPSAICRELSRNRGLRGYRPKQAHRLATQRKREATKAIKVTEEVRGWVKTLIRQELSPAQVAAYIDKEHGVSLHHETIYQLILADKKSGGDLYTHLRIMRKPYRKRYGSYDNRGRIRNRRSIEERPAVVDRKNRLGDWEGDTIIGKGRKGALLTMVDRKSLSVVIGRLAGKNAEALATELIDRFTELGAPMKTITFDNGLEFADHGRMSEALDVDIYFAHPYSSWERGANENTNGLIRQYFPKGMDLSTVTEKDIQFVMDRLNNRPRETLGWKTPNEVLWGQSVDLLAA